MAKRDMGGERFRFTRPEPAVMREYRHRFEHYSHPYDVFDRTTGENIGRAIHRYKPGTRRRLVGFWIAEGSDIEHKTRREAAEALLARKTAPAS